MDILKSIYYIRSNRYLCFFGHWPYQSLRTRVCHLSLIMLASFTIIGPQLAKLYQLRHDFHYFVLALPSIIFYTQYVLKNLFAALRMKQIKVVLEKITEDFKKFKGDDLQILHDYSAQAYKINTFYTVYMFMAVAAYSLLPFTLHVMDIILPLNESRLQIKPRLTTYFIDKFDENIFFIIIHGIIVDLMAIMLIIGFDTLYFSFAYHVCALFLIVKNKVHDALDIKHIKNEESKKFSDKEDIFYNNFIKTINMHQYALDFVQTLESSFSSLNLLSIGCAIVPLTITGFEVLLNKDNFGEMVRYVLFAFGEIIHLIYYNWPGQKIKDHSLLIYQTCYNCQWYNEYISARCKTLLSFVIVRSQKPCDLTAGKLYILGLENFAAVIKMSMSYFTVLSSVM